MVCGPFGGIYPYDISGVAVAMGTGIQQCHSIGYGQTTLLPHSEAARCLKRLPAEWHDPRKAAHCAQFVLPCGDVTVEGTVALHQTKSQRQGRTTFN